MKGFVIALLVAACAVTLVAGQDPMSSIPEPAKDMPNMAASGASMDPGVGMDQAKSIPGGDMATGMAGQASSMSGKKRRSVDTMFEDGSIF
ncbi:uncharacterized protein [Chelonus insularis]|uniref:uncharacterized protein isoform X2 n=1 Tax=Chelonus insularis TaxID=460826 RepID=UPI00158D2A54|nr:uncharacterized protein LOC118074392 isoform X2 [Chelonus insularis]